MRSNILNYSVTTQDDGTFRLDAEHYQKEFLNNQEKLIRFGSTPLLKMISRPVMTGHTPSMKIESYYGGDIGFVKTDNLREFNITGEFSHFLSKTGNEIIKRSSLKKGDLIVTIIGATHKIVGRAALVRKEDLPANINQNIALIRLKKQYSPEFLSAYLNCKTGKLALWYLSRQTEQVNLNCREVEKILIPNFSDAFIKYIENTYNNAVACEHKSRDSYKKAQTLLLDELGLTDWKPKHQLCFIKNQSDIVQAERIDAEYFQPKFDELLRTINNKSKYTKKISEIQTYNKRGLQPNYSIDGQLNVVTSKHILEDGLDYQNFEKTDSINWDEKRKARIKKGDILTYTTGANIGRTSYYPIDERALASNHVNILRIKDEDSEYVAFVMNSLVGRLQTERLSAGSAQAELYPKDIDKFVIPFIIEENQAKIRTKVNLFYDLRKQSKHLLECAKNAIEISIDQGEDYGITWLNKQIGSQDAE